MDVVRSVYFYLVCFGYASFCYSNMCSTSTFEKLPFPKLRESFLKTFLANKHK